MVEFVEDWFIEETLGEGAFGDVKLLVNRRTKDEVALKAVNLKDHPEAEDIVKKEVQIHKMLNHEHIVRFFGNRREKNTEYIFLEYCKGGELYDLIEPDIGISTSAAQNYFRQLISAVEYLHGVGVAHRDIKPENILLDAQGSIKLSDFGFATVFRSRGVERLLEKRCGTLPYVAPEVLTRPYKAAPADIWSCGIVLLALLGGELPWDSPTLDCVQYRTWKEGKCYGMPWTKLDLPALTFIKRLLCPVASRRITIEQIHGHSWLNRKIPGSKWIHFELVDHPIDLQPTFDLNFWSGCVDGKKPIPSPKKRKKSSGINLNTLEDSITRLCYSQPEPRCFGGPSVDDDEGDDSVPNPVENADLDEKCMFSFSQPVGTSDAFFLGSQLVTSPTKNCPPIQRWVKRMTRFFVQTSVDNTVKMVTKALDDLGYTWKLQSKPVLCITIFSTDRRKNKLVYKASVIEMGSGLRLLDFRLSRGDGLEFKRQFVVLKDLLASIEVSTGPLTTWPLAMVTNQVPV